MVDNRRTHGIKISDDQRHANRKRSMVAHQKLRAEHFTYPNSTDWRNVDGKDFTTSIKDQLQCGACTAFGTCGVGECVFKITQNDPTLQPDFSEQFLFNAVKGTCEDGADINDITQALVAPGTPDEACCEYLQKQVCPDAITRLFKATGNTEIVTDAEAKQWLATKGPLVSGMGVPKSFNDYNGGIFKQQGANDAIEGYHCIGIYGYNEKEGYWICKNSWGSDIWGEANPNPNADLTKKGWFKMGYGECGMGSDIPFFGFQAVKGPNSPNPNPEPDPTPSPINEIPLWIKIAAIVVTVVIIALGLYFRAN